MSFMLFALVVKVAWSGFEYNGKIPSQLVFNKLDPGLALWFFSGLICVKTVCKGHQQNGKSYQERR